jgi:hypothetical protein
MSTADPFVVGFPPLDFDRVLSQSVLSRATPAASAPASSGLEVAFVEKCHPFARRKSTSAVTPSTDRNHHFSKNGTKIVNFDVPSAEDTVARITENEIIFARRISPPRPWGHRQEEDSV